MFTSGFSDRYFMDKIVDHLFIFRGGVVEDFPGNYSDFRAYEDSTDVQKEENKARRKTGNKTTQGI
jgi:ATP-binding cassette subfamily F protein uup